MEITTREKPEGATHWSTRSLAAKLGIHSTFVSQVWRDNGLKPHLAKSFKVSNDPNFQEKLADDVGLYINPPENAAVFCVDEKSSIQALDRTQPGLPMKKGRAGTMTQDYKRNGTSTLFAALNVFTGEVIGACKQRHRHQEFLSFLKSVEKQTPKDMDLHVIVDDYSTHKHQKIKNWLKRNKRVTLHFIQTSSSWLNLVERFFGLRTDKAIRRGVFSSVKDLECKLMDFTSNHNVDPTPFVWTKSVEVILEKIARARAAFFDLSSGRKRRCPCNARNVAQLTLYSLFKAWMERTCLSMREFISPRRKPLRSRRRWIARGAKLLG
ncbi:MAG: IS630 family transposase [Granulosicoccus sp.]